MEWRLQRQQHVLPEPWRNVNPLMDGFDMFPAIKMVKFWGYCCKLTWMAPRHPIPGGIVGKSEAQQFGVSNDGFRRIFPQTSIHLIDWMYVHIWIIYLHMLIVKYNGLKWSIPTCLIVTSRHIQHFWWSPAFLMAPLISMSKDGPPAAPRYLSDEDSDGDFRRLSAWTWYGGLRGGPPRFLVGTLF